MKKTFSILLAAILVTTGALTLHSCTSEETFFNGPTGPLASFNIRTVSDQPCAGCLVYIAIGFFFLTDENGTCEDIPDDETTVDGGCTNSDGEIDLITDCSDTDEDSEETTTLTIIDGNGNSDTESVDCADIGLGSPVDVNSDIPDEEASPTPTPTPTPTPPPS